MHVSFFTDDDDEDGNKDDELRTEAVEDFIVLMDKSKLPDILAQVHGSCRLGRVFICFTLVVVWNIMCSLIRLWPGCSVNMDTCPRLPPRISSWTNSAP